jgi:hypothetical protein
MAFNPFRAFRKHQKVLFAVLTILCMFVFVLSGVGGFFQEFAGRFAFGDPFPEMASAYGKPISDRELRLLQQQRGYANLFMMAAAQQATLNSGQAVAQAVDEGKLDPMTKQALTQALQLRQLYVSIDPQRGYSEYNFGPEISRWIQFLPQLFENADRQLEQARLSLQAQKSQEAELVQQLQQVLAQDFALLQRARTGQYFEEYKTPKDLIDFLLLRHHADQLGIQFTGEDVDRLVTRETGGALRPVDSAMILKNVQRRFGGLTRDMLRSALGDEFRVRIARDALLGKPGQRQEAGLTPYEFWKFYRENRTTSNFVLASIAVDSPEFLKKVGQPTEQELRSLFEANKEREPDPASEQAGFKQPMRVRVQWVSAPADAPLYQRAAALESAVSLPLAYDLALLRAYESERYKYPIPSWLGWRMALQEKNMTRVDNVVAALGQPAAGAWPCVATAAAYTSSAAAHEVRDRSPRVAALILSLAGPNPLSSLAVAFAGTPKEEWLPLEAVRDRLVKKVNEDLATDLARSNLNALRDYLTTHARAKSDEVRGFLNTCGALAQALAIGTGTELGFISPAVYGALSSLREMLDRKRYGFEHLLAGLSASPWLAAELSYQRERLADEVIRLEVAELIRRYGFEHGSTNRPRDRFDVAGDRGLKPLRQAFEQWGGGTSSSKQEKQFAAELLGRSGDQSALYQPQPMAGDKFLFWRTAEEPAYVPSFDEARPRVEARWRFEKSRQLAQQEADKIAAEARKAKGDAEKNLTDAAKRFGRLIHLDKVARLTTRPAMVPSGMNFNSQSYEPYQVPQSDVEYPSKDFVKELLGLKERGDVTVLHDAPEATYYVAALVDRSAPFELSFVTDASRPDSLLEWWERETQSRQKFRDGCMEELRREAKLQYNDQNLDAWKTSTSNDEE